MFTVNFVEILGHSFWILISLTYFDRITSLNFSKRHTQTVAMNKALIRLKHILPPSTTWKRGFAKKKKKKKDSQSLSLTMHHFNERNIHTYTFNQIKIVTLIYSSSLKRPLFEVYNSLHHIRLSRNFWYL